MATMRLLKARLLLLLPLIALCLLDESASHAELGGAVSADALQIQEKFPADSSGQRLYVFQIKLPTGTQIREFANGEHVVVGVSWQGPTLPNLKQLLGPYFDTFAKRPPTKETNHHSAEFFSDELVVQSHGQLHSFSGRAYLPQRLPAGITADQIN